MAPGRVRSWLVRSWRLTALFLAALLLQRTTPLADSALTQLGLADARAFFPEAKRLKSGPQQTLLVEDRFGNSLGRLLTTAPDADAIIGYAGPSNVLVALDNQEKIVGTRILSSQDTPEHVDQLRAPEFLRAFQNWRPTTQPSPKLEAYAGSTLTAYAISESIQKRLSGNYVSLRFPAPVTLADLPKVGFTTAQSFEPNVPRLGWYRVFGPQNALLGYVVRSSPSGDEVNGYAGPSETLIALAPDGRTLRQVFLRSSYDSSDYVERIYDDAIYLKSLTQWSTKEWAQMDFQKARIEGVSGATLTSFAIAEGLKRRFADDLGQGPRPAGTSPLKSLALWCFLVGAVVMTFTPLHGRPMIRLSWQILLIAGLGLWLGQLLSLSLLAGWARHGLPWGPAPALVLLGGLALLIPWSTRRQAYCHHVCPHGAAQELLGRFPQLHLTVPARLHGWLSKGPAVVLGGAFLAALTWPRWSLGQVEPFDAWVLGTAVLIPLVLAGLGLAASLCIPQAYCKYGCPTGALLRFVRTTSADDHWSPRDTVAGLLLAVGAGLSLLPAQEIRETKSAAALATPTEIHGAAFGTTWTVKVRGASADTELLKRAIEAEINRVEFSFSHWRESSTTTDFNRLASTRPMGINQEFADLVAWTLQLHTASGGLYDITVAPLTSLWGYGPAGSKLPDPSAAQIQEALTRVGSSKLTLDKTALTLAKDNPGVALDLGSILQGYAADCVARTLRAQGQEDFLIEVGGELLAAGAWWVAIEDPFNPRAILEKILLTDRALSTSGLYRAKKLAAGKPVSHILSPQTGRPVEPTLELAVVLHPNCLNADGWSTALMAAGFEQAKIIAEREGLEVILVTPDKKVWRSRK